MFTNQGPMIEEKEFLIIEATFLLDIFVIQLHILCNATFALG